MTRHVPGHITHHSTSTVSKTTTHTRRLESLTTRPGESLTSMEENTLRMHHGLTCDLEAPLPTNAINAALRHQMLEMELAAYEATGRATMQRVPGEDDADAGSRSPKDKIVARLRKP